MEKIIIRRVKGLVWVVLPLSLFSFLPLNAQKREKYEFKRNLPVYADSLLPTLTSRWLGVIVTSKTSASGVVWLDRKCLTAC